MRVLLRSASVSVGWSPCSVAKIDRGLPTPRSLMSSTNRLPSCMTRSRLSAETSSSRTRLGRGSSYREFATSRTRLPSAASDAEGHGRVDKVFLDYDSTITRGSSIELQLKAIQEAVAQTLNEATAAQRINLERKLTADYLTAYKEVTEDCLGMEKIEGFDWRTLQQINSKFTPFEKKMNCAVEDSGILKGVPEDVFLGAARHTEMQPHCIWVLESCVKRGIQVHVLSVNWSGHWIRRSLECQSSLIRQALNKPDMPIRISANELEYKDGVSTGRLLKQLECSDEKGTQLRALIKEGQFHGRTVFIGDSVLDLDCLLLADIGIVFGKDQTLQSFLDVCSVSTVPLGQRPGLEESTGGAPEKGSVVYTTQSWTEIGEFLFPGLQPLPRVLVVAGSDSGGGAGIQADIKTCAATGSFATTVITAVTSQNTLGVQAIHPIPIPHVESQLDSILTDIGTDAIKTGMLPSVQVVHAIAAKLREHGMPFLVVDPVMLSTSGHALSSNDVAAAMVQKLFPLATVVCPNIPEAEVLTETQISSLSDMEQAARMIHLAGPKAVLIKGGHLRHGRRIVDVVYDGEGLHRLEHVWVETDRLHGTGCTLASAIASNLAKGRTPLDAIRAAVSYVAAALSYSRGMDLGKGRQLPFDHSYRWSRYPAGEAPRGRLDLRLYGITDQRNNAKRGRSFAEAVGAALRGGVTCLQVREKDADGGDFVQRVRVAMKLAKPYGIPVIVNDRVDIALVADADGVHLGQEDLPVWEVRRLLGTEKILGVSAKTVKQAVAAEGDGADYLGVGAMFPTQSKASSVVGAAGLRVVRDAVKIPIVGIGGITETNLSAVLTAGADGIAVISAIFDVADVEAATSRLRQHIDRARSSII